MADTPGAASEAETAIASLLSTVQRLISPGGCAWHEVQTHESLIPFLLEETAEFVDAVERELPAEDVAAELGDVLYQVLFHAAIAARESEGYDFERVAERLNQKLIARHPHVFGDRDHLSLAQLRQEWEHLKEDAAGVPRGSRSVLEGIPAGMPTLARAAKIVERLHRAGRLPAAAQQVIQAADRALPRATATLDEHTLGQAMLDLVLLANSAGIDPDRALRRATATLTNMEE